MKCNVFFILIFSVLINYSHEDDNGKLADRQDKLKASNSASSIPRQNSLPELKSTNLENSNNVPSTPLSLREKNLDDATSGLVFSELRQNSPPVVPQRNRLMDLVSSLHRLRQGKFSISQDTKARQGNVDHADNDSSAKRMQTSDVVYSPKNLRLRQGNLVRSEQHAADNMDNTVNASNRQRNVDHNYSEKDVISSPKRLRNLDELANTLLSMSNNASASIRQNSLSDLKPVELRNDISNSSASLRQTVDIQTTPSNLRQENLAERSDALIQDKVSPKLRETSPEVNNDAKRNKIIDLASALARLRQRKFTSISQNKLSNVRKVNLSNPTNTRSSQGNVDHLDSVSSAKQRQTDDVISSPKSLSQGALLTPTKRLQPASKRQDTENIKNINSRAGNSRDSSARLGDVKHREGNLDDTNSAKQRKNISALASRSGFIENYNDGNWVLRMNLQPIKINPDPKPRQAEANVRMNLKSFSPIRGSTIRKRTPIKSPVKRKKGKLNSPRRRSNIRSTKATPSNAKKRYVRKNLPSNVRLLRLQNGRANRRREKPFYRIRVKNLPGRRRRIIMKQRKIGPNIKKKIGNLHRLRNVILI